MKLVNVDSFRKFIPILRKLSLLSLFGLLLLTNDLVAQSISVTGVATTPVCAGSNVTITFNATNGGGKFTNTTIYTIYLSNSSGTSFTSIGLFSTSGVTYSNSGTGTTSGITRLVTIPNSTTTGTGYKISLGSDAPAVTGSGGAGASPAFTINARPTPTFTSSPASNICLNSIAIYTTQSGQSNYIWTVPGSAGTDYLITAGSLANTSNTVTLQWLSTGSKTVTVNYTNANGCTGTTAASSATTVNAFPTITPAAAATSVCFNSSSQTTPLTYSSPTGSPTTYSITWDASPSNTFATVTNASLPSSPITISVPAATVVGTYTGHLTVSNVGGCVSSSSSFTVTVNEVPTIALATSATDVCFSSGSQTTSLTYSAISGTPTTYSITWNGSPSNSFVAVTNAALLASPITINVPAGTAAGTYTGNLTVKNANGCVSSSSSFTVTIDRPTITLAAAATSVCFNSGSQTTPLTYSATTGTPITYTITWNPAPGNSFVPLTDVALAPPTQITIDIPAGTPVGTYTGNLTVKNASGCVSSSSSFTVTVNGEPAITLAVAAASVCFSSSGQTTSLTYSAPTNSPTNYSITWDVSPPNSFVTVTDAALPASPITIAVPAGTAPGTYTGNLTVRNGGCIGSATSIFTVTVHPLPTIALAASATSVCFSSGAQTTPLTYGATSETPTTYSITWNSTPANTFAAILNEPLPATPPISIAVPAGTIAGIYTGNLTVKNANGCVSATSIFTVTVNALPVPTFTTPPITLGCAGVNMIYTTELGQANYVWGFPGTAGVNYTIESGGTSGSNTVTLKWITAGSKVVTINYTNSNSCTAVAATSSASATIYSGAPLTPGSISGGISQCASSTGFTYFIAPVSEATTYTWAVPSEWTINSGAVTTSISVTSGAAGQNGNITVTAANFCGTSAASTLAVTVTPRPTIALGTMPTVCLGTTIANLTYSATTQSPTQYSIDFDAAASAAGFTDVNSAALASPIVIAVPASNVSGAYNGILTITNGTCISEAYPITVSVNAVDPGSLSNPAPICNGGTIVLSPSAATVPAGSTLTYQWQISTNNSTWNNIALATNASYTTTPITITPLYFKRIATNVLNGVTCQDFLTVMVEATITSAVQTSADGIWTLSSTWGGSAPPGQNTGSIFCPVLVQNNVTLNGNISIQDGAYSVGNLSTNVLDNGAVLDNLIVSRSGSYDQSLGVFDVRGGATNFQGGATISNGTLIVRNNATLILGPTQCSVCDCSSPSYNAATCATLGATCTQNRLTIGDKTRIIIEPLGKIFIYGNVINSNNQGTMTINGFVTVTGNYATNNGSTEVVQEIDGIGDMYTCGTMISQGAGTIYGSDINCTAGPCLASNLKCSHVVSMTPIGLQGFCNGVTLDAVTNAPNPFTLTWQYNTNGSTTFIDATSQVNDLTYDWPNAEWPSSLTSTAWYRVKVTTPGGQGCTAYSYIAQLVPGANSWRGTVSNDWNNILNWCINVPTSSEDVTIGLGTPTISGNNTANVNNLIINGGASVILSGTPTLNIYGDLSVYNDISGMGKIDGTAGGTVVFAGGGTNKVQGNGQFNFGGIIIPTGQVVNFAATNDISINVYGDLNFAAGSFTQGTSTLYLLGGADQAIDANGNTFNNIIINKPPVLPAITTSVSLSSSMNLYKKLSINSATIFDSNGHLTIKSTSKSTAGDGSIGPILNGGSVIDNVNVERYMAAVAGEQFRYIGSPVDNVPKPSNLGQLYAYNGGWAKYYANMQIGQGFASLTGGQVSWLVTGPVHYGDFTEWTLSPGWNLLGNPYASPIRWSTVEVSGGTAWEGSNVATLVAVTDNTTTGYPNYFRYSDYANPIPDYNNNGLPDDPLLNGVIAMGQSFWVYAGAGATLKVKEGAKAIPSGEFYRTSGVSPTQQLIISVNNERNTDQTFLKMKNNEGKQSKQDFDLPKLWNEKMDIYLLDDKGKEMLTLSLTEITEQTKIPLGLKVSEPGEYEISFKNSKSFENTLYLIDSYEGEAIPVSPAQTYKVTINNATNPVNDRFYLSSSPKIEWSAESAISVYPNPVKDILKIQVMGLKEISTAVLMDVSGKILGTTDFKGDGTIDMASYPEGMYILKVKTANGMVTKKIVKYN